MCLGMMERCDMRRKDSWCRGNSRSDFRMNCVIAALANVRPTQFTEVDCCKRSIKSIRNAEKATSFKYVECRNVYSTNRIDVASSKRTCFAHIMGH